MGSKQRQKKKQRRKLTVEEIQEEREKEAKLQRDRRITIRQMNNPDASGSTTMEETNIQDDALGDQMDVDDAIMDDDDVNEIIIKNIQVQHPQI